MARLRPPLTGLWGDTSEELETLGHFHGGGSHLVAWLGAPPRVPPTVVAQDHAQNKRGPCGVPLHKLISQLVSFVDAAAQVRAGTTRA